MSFLKTDLFTEEKTRRPAASSLRVCMCGINVGAVYSLPVCSLQAQHCGLISLILFLGYYDHKSLNIHVGRD